MLKGELQYKKLSTRSMCLSYRLYLIICHTLNFLLNRIQHLLERVGALCSNGACEP